MFWRMTGLSTTSPAILDKENFNLEELLEEDEIIEECKALNGRLINLLGRLQDSNAALSHFNKYSEHCFGEVAGDFPKNTRLLKSMKSDLDYIFQKLRSTKAKILATYPDAFPDESTREALDRRPDLEIPL